MNMMLIFVTIIFGVCWLPRGLVKTLLAVDYKRKWTWKCWKFAKITHNITYVIAMSSTCYNPFLYGFMNTAFKEAFSNLWSCAKKTNATRVGDGENEPGLVEEIRIEDVTLAAVATTE